MCSWIENIIGDYSHLGSKLEFPASFYKGQHQTCHAYNRQRHPAKRYKFVPHFEVGVANRFHSERRTIDNSAPRSTMATKGSPEIRKVVRNCLCPPCEPRVKAWIKPDPPAPVLGTARAFAFEH